MMDQPVATDELLTLAEASQRYGVALSTLYRCIAQGDLPTHRRAVDRHVHVRRADIEAVRRLRHPVPAGLTIEAVERARAFQHRVFGSRVLAVSSAELIEEGRHERDAELPRARHASEDK